MSGENPYSGVFTINPIPELVDGLTLNFRPRAAKPQMLQDFRFASLDNWEFFEGILLTLSFGLQNELRTEGSAVLIAPGIALCATHVVAPRMSDLLAGRIAATCFGVTSHGLQIWQVRSVTHAPNSDLTILAIDLASSFPPGNVFYQAAISTRTPKEGEDLLICGFRVAEPSFFDGPESTGMRGELKLAKGPVTAKFPVGRDSSMMPWPSVEVSCPSLGGMSGGPVFDSNGLLVGLLSSSINFNEDEGVSYISLAWPSLSARIQSVWPPGMMKEPQCLLEMDRRVCIIDKPEAVERIPHVSGDGYLTKYREWG